MNSTCQQRILEASALTVWGLLPWHGSCSLFKVNHLMIEYYYVLLLFAHLHPFIDFIIPSDDGYFQDNNLRYPVHNVFIKSLRTILDSFNTWFSHLDHRIWTSMKHIWNMFKTENRDTQERWKSYGTMGIRVWFSPWAFRKLVHPWHLELLPFDKFKEYPRDIRKIFHDFGHFDVLFI